jgi:tripartite-type tricarboxylate transporter receptor subunit TctC
VILVPYPGPTEALKDVRGGQIDLVIDVPSVAPPDQSLVKIHSITGVDNYNGRFTLLSNQVDKNFAYMSVDFFIMAPASMSPELVNRLQAILNQAIINNAQLAEAYRVDTVSVKPVDMNKWYQDNIKIWKGFTEKIQISE